MNITAEINVLAEQHGLIENMGNRQSPGNTPKLVRTVQRFGYKHTTSIGRNHFWHRGLDHFIRINANGWMHRNKATNTNTEGFRNKGLEQHLASIHGMAEDIGSPTAGPQTVGDFESDFPPTNSDNDINCQLPPYYQMSKKKTKLMKMLRRVISASKHRNEINIHPTITTGLGN